MSCKFPIGTYPITRNNYMRPFRGRLTISDTSVLCHTISAMNQSGAGQFRFVSAFSLYHARMDEPDHRFEVLVLPAQFRGPGICLLRGEPA